MEAVVSLEALVNFYQTTRFRTPEDNLKSHGHLDSKPYMEIYTRL